MEPQWNQEAEFDVPDGVKPGQLLFYANFLDDLGGSTGDVLAELQKSDDLDNSDSVYGNGKLTDALCIERDEVKPPIIKKRGSADPKSSFIRDDLKEGLPEDKLVTTLVKANWKI